MSFVNPSDKPGTIILICCLIKPIIAAFCNLSYPYGTFLPCLKTPLYFCCQSFLAAVSADQILRSYAPLPSLMAEFPSVHFSGHRNTPRQFFLFHRPAWGYHKLSQFLFCCFQSARLHLRPFIMRSNLLRSQISSYPARRKYSWLLPRLASQSEPSCPGYDHPDW